MIRDYVYMCIHVFLPCIHCTYYIILLSFISHLHVCTPFSPPPFSLSPFLPLSLPSLSSSLPSFPSPPPPFLPLSLPPLSSSLLSLSLSSPSDELLFRGPSGQELLCNVVLTNTTDAIVAYKVSLLTPTQLPCLVLVWICM